AKPSLQVDDLPLDVAVPCTVAAAHLRNDLSTSAGHRGVKLRIEPGFVHLLGACGDLGGEAELLGCHAAFSPRAHSRASRKSEAAVWKPAPVDRTESNKRYQLAAVTRSRRLASRLEAMLLEAHTGSATLTES